MKGNANVTMLGFGMSKIRDNIGVQVMFNYKPMPT